MEKLISIRKAKKLSQYELALKADISQGAISYIENGNRSPTLYTLQRLAAALEVDIQELVS